MKAEVLEKFKDIKTGKIYKAGEIITVSEKRFEEILKNGKEKGKEALVRKCEDLDAGSIERKK